MHMFIHIHVYSRYVYTCNTLAFTTGPWRRSAITYGDVVKIHIVCGTLTPRPETQGTVWFIAKEKYGDQRLKTTK